MANVISRGNAVIAEGDLTSYAKSATFLFRMSRTDTVFEGLDFLLNICSTDIFFLLHDLPTRRTSWIFILRKTRSTDQHCLALGTTFDGTFDNFETDAAIKREL